MRKKKPVSGKMNEDSYMSRRRRESALQSFAVAVLTLFAASTYFSAPVSGDGSNDLESSVTSQSDGGSLAMVYPPIGITSTRQLGMKQVVLADGRSDYEPEYARLSDWLVERLDSIDIETLAVYDSSVLVRVTKGNTDRVRSSGLYIYEIPSNAAASREGLQMSLDGAIEIDDTADSPGQYLISFIGPIDGNWLEILENCGVKLRQFMPNYAYVVQIPRTSMGSIISLPFIWDIVPWRVENKLAPTLAQRTDGAPVRFYLYSDADIDDFVSLAESIDAQVINRSDGNDKQVYLLVGQSGVMELAGNADVSWVEPDVDRLGALLNDQARWVIQSGSPGSYPIHAEGIRGQFDIVTNGPGLITMADTGLDANHQDFYDSEPIGPTHRKIHAYYVPFGAYGDGVDGQGHGTHVAGTIIGDSPPYEDYSNHDGQAYEARIIVQDMDAGGMWGEPDPGYYAGMFDSAYTAGSRVHSNSWGDLSWDPPLGPGYHYLDEARMIDQFAWQSDRRDFVIVFGVGNEGGLGTLRLQPMAKDVISVGATENARSPLDPSNVASFSSRGPTEDGRLKPNVLTPGQGVISARAAGTNIPTCTEIDQNYRECSGTSMATPAAAGAAELVRQYFSEGWYPRGVLHGSSGFNPSSALVRAILINGAEEITGIGSHDHPYQRPGLGWSFEYPNTDQGWGRVNLDNILYFADEPSPKKYLYLVDETAGLATGRYAEYSVEVTDSDVPFEATLVWTDPPGTNYCNPCLVNNLDLLVTDPAGNMYRGNVFVNDGGAWQSKTNPTEIHDYTNVEEAVIRQTPAAGVWKIRVMGTNVPQGPQPFALVVTGAKGVEKLTIEGSADKVAFEVVRLNVESSTATEMCFSNTGTCGNWEPYAPTKYPWLLIPGAGVKTVYAQLKQPDNTITTLEAQVEIEYWDDREDVSNYGRGVTVPAPPSAHDPRIATEPATINTLYATWWEEKPSTIDKVRFAYSLTRGTVWNRIVGEEIEGRNPDIVVCGGLIHLVWQYYNGANWDIYYIQRDIYNIRWLMPIVSGIGDQQFPRIGCGPEGLGGGFALHVVYQDWDGTVKYVRSSNNGNPGSWASPVAISGSIDQRSTHPAISVWDRYIHVVLEKNFPTKTQVAYVRHPLYGDVGPWNPEYMPVPTTNNQKRPDVASSGNYVHWVWDELWPGLNYEQIMYIGNFANGENYGWPLKPQILSLPTDSIPTSRSMSPTIDSYSSTVAVAWQGDSEGHWEVHFARHYDNGDPVSPWERWSRITFAGYHARDAVAPALALWPSSPPSVSLVWQDEVWGGWDISFKSDTTSRGEIMGPDSPISDLSVEVVQSPYTDDMFGKTYQYGITVNTGIFEPAEPGGPVWNRHTLKEVGGSLEAIYAFTIPHAQGHDVGWGTDYYLTICATNTPDTPSERFLPYFAYTPTGPWTFIGSLVIDYTFTCGTHQFFTNEHEHHGYMWVKIVDENPGDPVDHQLEIWSPEFEDMGGAMWLSANFAGSEAKTDLRLTWTLSDGDTTINPSGHVTGYDIYMANGNHDSYFIRVGSVPAGTSQLILHGGAVAGSPEVIWEGPGATRAMRYPRDAYFIVIPRDAEGRTVPTSLAERVGKFTIDLPTSAVLLSLPLVTPTTYVLNVFAPIEGHWSAVRRYDAWDHPGHWKSYVVGRPYNDFQDVDRTMGLWLDLAEDSNGILITGLFPVFGKIPPQTQITLYYQNGEGYNLVGYPYLTAAYHHPFGFKTVAEALFGLPYVMVETYDSTAPPYYLKVLSDNDYMFPGLGYWVTVTDQAIWTLDNDLYAEGLI